MKYQVILLLGLLPALPAGAIDLQDQRIKVEGVWKNGRLLSHKLKFRNPQRNPKSGQITGRIEVFDKPSQTMKIGPKLIRWDEKTAFMKINQSDLKVGQMVTVRGLMKQPGNLNATEIKLDLDEDPEVLQIIGAVRNRQPLANDAVLVELIGIPVEISGQLRSSLILLTRRQDDLRPEKQLALDLAGRPLVIGGEVGVNPRYRRNFDLDPGDQDDLLRWDTEFQLEFFYALNNETAFFAEAKGNREVQVFKEGGGGTSDNNLERGETWLFMGDVMQSGVSLQVGRQNFQDVREWWWDEDLDSVRLYYNQPFMHYELGVAQRLAPLDTSEGSVDPRQKDVLRVLSRASWVWSKNELGIFFLHQNDYSDTETVGQLLNREDLNDGQLTWGGVRSFGDWDTEGYGEFEYWVDTALVGGEETLLDFEDDDNGKRIVDSRDTRDVYGWALDVGLTWELPVSWNPSLTLGYAIGSREFRQTGIQNNNNRFSGVDRFRYYGELLRPDLSNLQIWTVSFGFPIMRDSSVEFLYHYYKQTDAADSLRDARVDDDLTGRSRSVGQELDLVIGLQEWENLEMELVAAAFHAESAFGDLSGETSFNINLKINYNF